MIESDTRAPQRWPLRDPWRPVPAWRRYLIGVEPRRILAQLIPGDPLRIRALAGERVVALARMVDVDAVVLMALARIAQGAALEGAPTARGWLVEQVDRAIEDAVGEGAGSSSGPPGMLEALAPGVGVTPGAFRRSCEAFNRRSLAERMAFWSLVLAAEPPEVAARREGAAPDELARRSRRVLEAMVRAAAKGEAA